MSKQKKRRSTKADGGKSVDKSIKTLMLITAIINLLNALINLADKIKS